MRKDILAKAVRLADKSKARPDKVVIGKPAAANKKPVVPVLSERLYTIRANFIAPFVDSLAFVAVRASGA